MAAVLWTMYSDLRGVFALPLGDLLAQVSGLGPGGAGGGRFCRSLALHLSCRCLTESNPFTVFRCC